jgi:hypothetical protein
MAACAHLRLPAKLVFAWFFIWLIMLPIIFSVVSKLCFNRDSSTEIRPASAFFDERLFSFDKCFAAVCRTGSHVCLKVKNKRRQRV